MDELAYLVALAREGDRGAFGDLVERTVGDVRARIAAICPSASLIDDLAQETYLRAYQALPGYTHEGKFLGWLRGIATNVVLEELRRPKREVPSGYDALASLVDERVVDRASLHGSEQRVASLLECLKAIGGHGRRLLEEFYVAGRSSGDIAQAFSRTASWVRVSVLRLRRKLVECVQARLADEGAVQR